MLADSSGHPVTASWPTQVCSFIPCVSWLLALENLAFVMCGQLVLTYSDRQIESNVEYWKPDDRINLPWAGQQGLPAEKCIGKYNFSAVKCCSCMLAWKQ